MLIFLVFLLCCLRRRLGDRFFRFLCVVAGATAAAVLGRVEGERAAVRHALRDASRHAPLDLVQFE